MRKTLLTLMIGLVLLPLSALAQFDFGGGSSAPPADPWTQFRLNPSTRMKLDFRNANIDLVIQLFSRTSGITIVKDPALTGPVTVLSAKAVPLREAFEILNTVLGLKGFDFKKEGNLLVIRKRQQDGRGGGNPFQGMSPEQMQGMFQGQQSELRVYPLKFAGATSVSRVINEVFAGNQDPTQQFFQQMMGGGAGGGGNPFQRGGQGGQGGRGGGNPFQGGFGGRGGFGQRGGSTVRASADEFSNSVIVNAPSRDQDQVRRLIDQIDRETDAPVAPKVYKLQYAFADEIAPAVQNVLTSAAPTGRGAQAGNVPFEQRIQQAARFGSGRAAFGTVVPDARTNSLVVTATAENQELVAQVIKELDQQVTAEASTFVVPLSNARADDVAGLMNQAFGNRTGAGTQRRTNQVGARTTNQNNQRRTPGTNNATGGFGGGRGPSSESLELDLEDPSADAGNLETIVAVQQGGFFGGGFGGFGGNRNTQSVPAGRDAQGRAVNVRDLTGQVTVIPDPNTNSLIVVTTPDNRELITNILNQLDRIPEQVMIETIIVEATLDASSKMGIEWTLSNPKVFNQTGVRDTTAANFGLQNASPALQGLRYTLTGGNLSAFVNAMQTDTRFKVLSTPRIFTSNNSEAQINISQRVPYVLSSREDTNGNLTFTYAFEDVGIVLTVTPRITANGYVTMDVSQSANDLQGFTSFNAPIINQRQADTTVSVQDGETIILGGIIRNTVSTTTKKIPLLGDIPILGNLFRSTDRQNVNTELLVFLTPRIVRDADEARRLRQEDQQRLSKPTQDTLKDAVREAPPVEGPKETPAEAPPTQAPPARR